MPNIIHRMRLSGQSSETPGTGDGGSSFTQFDIWSIMHFAMQPIGVPFPGADSGIIEGDKAMMLGAYSGYNYS